jgi:MscS family membrane protein
MSYSSSWTDFFINFSGGLLPLVVNVLVALIIFGVLFMLRRKIVTGLLTLLRKLTARLPHAAGILNGFEKPLVMMIVVLAGYISLQLLLHAFGVLSFPFLNVLLRALVIVAVTWGLVNASDAIVGAVKGEKTVLDQTIVSFLSKIVKVVILVLAAVMVMDAFDYDITGVITGLGITGLTIALAAQDTASNFFGGLIIIADKPFAVGDWIQTSSVEGIVEDISIRSTRIRTFKDAVIIVPNSSLASSEIINWSRMNKRKVEMTLGFTYQTSHETLEAVVAGIKELLARQEAVVDPVVVGFAGFGASSLDVTVNYFVNRTTMAEYSAVKEQLNFQIMDLCEKLGAEFAYPTQTVFLEQPEIKPAD